MDDLIRRKNAIDALKEIDLYKNNTIGQLGVLKSILAIELLPSAQPKLKWIPCSERLPEEGEYSDWYEGHRSDNVLITVDDGVTEAFTIDGVWNWYIDSDYYKEIQEKVIAWMPLPEPYKEGDNG